MLLQVIVVIIVLIVISVIYMQHTDCEKEESKEGKLTFVEEEDENFFKSID